MEMVIIPGRRRLAAVTTMITIIWTASILGPLTAAIVASSRTTPMEIRQVPPFSPSPTYNAVDFLSFQLFCLFLRFSFFFLSHDLHS